MRLTLSKRPGQIGPSINTRTEKHGEDDVPGIDIPVSGIFLDADELGVVLQDSAASVSFYTSGKTPEPRFPNLAPIGIEGRLEGAKVLIQVNEHQLLLKPAKIKNIRLEFVVGGLTHMSCTIQGNPSANTDVLELLNAKCRISISGAERSEKADDPELPLGHEGQASDEGNSSIWESVQVSARAKRRAPKKRTRADIDG